MYIEPCEANDSSKGMPRYLRRCYLRLGLGLVSARVRARVRYFVCVSGLGLGLPTSARDFFFLAS